MPGPGLFVRQTSLTEGTGPFTLVAAATGDQAFSDIYTPGNGDDIYAVVRDALGNWQGGVARLLGDGTLSFASVTQSSNGGAAVDFPPGSKTIIETSTSEAITALATAIATAQAAVAVAFHLIASDPHGDRAFTEAAASAVYQLASDDLAAVVAGLGGAATLDVGTTAGTVAAGDDAALVAARRHVGAATIGSNTFDVDLSSTSKVDQRRAADGAVTFGVTGMASGVGASCYVTNTTGSDIAVSVLDDIAWDGGEAPPTTLGAGLTLTLAFFSLSTTSESVQAAWMIGEVPA